MDRNGQPLATLTDTGTSERISEQSAEDDAWERMWRAIDRIRDRNTHLNPDDVLRHVTEVVEEVRQERYERGQQTAADGR